jgi:hypothetical protein
MRQHGMTDGSRKLCLLAKQYLPFKPEAVPRRDLDRSHLFVGHTLLLKLLLQFLRRAIPPLRVMLD